MKGRLLHHQPHTSAVQELHACMCSPMGKDARQGKL